MQTYGALVGHLIKKFPKAFAPERSLSGPSHPQISAKVAAGFMKNQPLPTQGKQKKPKRVPRR